MSGTQSKPKVVSAPGFLLLHLDDGNFQSLMRKNRPHRLELGYTRTLMGFLLFNPEPRHIAMIGLGGGSMPKYCYRYLRASKISVIEINPEVIALRDLFHIPADDARFSVTCEDGADFVMRQRAALDVLVVDGFDAGGQVPQLCSQQFYDDCHASLCGGGVLSVNILGADAGFDTYLARIRHSFGNAYAVRSEDCENRIVFAVKLAEHQMLDSAELEARRRRLDRQHGIKFGHVAGQLSPLFPA